MDANILEKAITYARGRLEKARYSPAEEPEINGAKPSAYGVRKLPGRRVLKALVKVETEDTWAGEAARKSMGAFSEWSAKYQSRTAMLFVPAGCAREARKHLPDYDEYYEFPI